MRRRQLHLHRANRAVVALGLLIFGLSRGVVSAPAQVAEQRIAREADRPWSIGRLCDSVVEWSLFDARRRDRSAVRLADSVAWARFWRDHVRDAPAPLVDFRRYMILGVVLPDSGAAAGYGLFCWDLQETPEGLALRYAVAGYHGHRPGGQPAGGSRIGLFLLRRSGRPVLLRPAQIDVAADRLQDVELRLPAMPEEPASP